MKLYLLKQKLKDGHPATVGIYRTRAEAKEAADRYGHGSEELEITEWMMDSEENLNNEKTTH